VSIILIDAWLTVLQRLGAQGDVAGTGARLISRWAQQHRRYHDLDHLQAVLRHVDDLAGHATDADAVRLAAWYHDAVYQGSDDDEEASAQLAADELSALGLSDAVVAEVVRLVRLTATHDPAADDRNGVVLCDADLAVLASPPHGYAGYVAAIRAEHPGVDDEAFRTGRTKLLQSLSERPALFGTPYGREHWEAPARANLERELARLTVAS
jgi:predicted metal-dependent HD superfamily phosphohydrolase